MAETARRIKTKRTFSLKKGGMFLGIAVLAIIILILVFSGGEKDEVAEEVIIKDKEVIAIICADTSCVAINKDGVAFRESSQTSGSLFFLLSDKTGRENLKVGGDIISPDTLAEIFYLKNKIEEEFSVRLKEGETYDKNFKDFEFKIDEGWVLKLSTENNASATIEVLRRVLDELGSTRLGLEYIDLRIPTRVYYK